MKLESENLIKIKKFKEIIFQSTDIIIAIHMKPDGDAISSALAVKYLLQNNFHCKPTIFCSTPPMPFYATLWPEIKEFTSAIEIFQKSVDLIIVLDCSSINQIFSEGQSPLKLSIPLINIDHHSSNNKFGKLNIVDETAASTTEIIFFVFQIIGNGINQKIADFLLTGLLTDTVGFRTLNTTPRSLFVAQELMKAGGNLYEISQYLFSGPKIGLIIKQSKILQFVEFDNGSKIAFLSINRKMRSMMGMPNDADLDQYGSIANLIRNSRDVILAVVLVELTENNIKISLRSKPGFDCASFAKRYEGGGHYAAAGINIRGMTLEKVKKLLMKDLGFKLTKVI